MWPSQSWTTTRSVYWRAMADVSSVLWESTTTISSAQATDVRAEPRSAASFLATTVTESFGTGGVYLRSGGSRGSGRSRWVRDGRPGGTGREREAFSRANEARLKGSRSTNVETRYRATCTRLTPPLIGTCCTASKSTSDLL